MMLALSGICGAIVLRPRLRTRQNVRYELGLSGGPRGYPACPTMHKAEPYATSGKNVLAVVDALGDFGQQRGAFRHGIFHLDGGLELVLFLFHHEKDFFDGRVALAKRHVGTVVGLAILNVHVGYAIVMLLDPRRRRSSGGREEVADVHIGAVVLGISEGLFPRCQTAEG